jgi:hypothetical protein
MIADVQGRLNAEFEKRGIARLDGQNTNNVLCEFFKLHRAIEKGGKPSRKYKPSAEPLPPAFDELPEAITVEPESPVEAEPAATPEPEAIPAYILDDVPPIAPEPPRVHEARAKALPPPESETERNADGYPSHEPGASERDTGKQADFYIYEDARGRFYLGVKRTTTKVFPQYHWDGKQWVKGLPKGFLKIPYRLPELLDAPADAWVVIAAGEKDALTAVRLGFVATTNPGGEGKGQWTPELNKWFSGRRRVAVMEDNDKTGHAHVVEVANALRGIVADIRIVQFRELPLHGDLTDWIAADPKRGHAELLARIEQAPAAVGYELIKASAVVRRAVLWWWPGHIARGELEILTGAQRGEGSAAVRCDHAHRRRQHRPHRVPAPRGGRRRS